MLGVNSPSKEKDKGGGKKRSMASDKKASSSPSKKVTSPVVTTKETSSSKRVKFSSSTVDPAKCLTVASSVTKELKIQVQESDSTKDPIVVSFPSGLPMSLQSGDEKSKSSSSSSSSSPAPTFTWAAARKAASKGRILYGTDDTCTYTAMNDGRGHDGRLTKLYVAIYHKPTRTVQFIPSSEKGTIFAMNQMVTDYEDAKSLDFRNLSMNERRRMVFETFGSNKKKKVLRSQDANVVEMRSVVGAGSGMMKSIQTQIDTGIISESNVQVMSDNMTMESEMNRATTALEKAYAEARRAFLPPFDETATKAYRVYDSQEVAGEEAWAQLSRVVDACIRKEDWKEAFQNSGRWSASTSKLLNLVSDPNRKGSKYQLKTICLVNHLVNFHNKASKKFIQGTVDEIVKYLGLPRAVADRFLEVFCVASFDRGRAGFAVTKQLKDRRVVYALIMYLLAHGKEMKVGSIDELCQDMSIETKDAMNLYREAGCKCVKGKTGAVSVSLSVPLQFPPPKRGKKT